ncbi:MAG: beta-ketoacyl-ACP synthase III [Vampirovibrionales bacterium]
MTGTSFLHSTPYGVCMTGVGAKAPDTVIANADLTALVDTSDEWIVTRTGISNRHVLAGDERLADLCIESAHQALVMAGLEGKDIDLVIACTTSPDERFPALAARIQHGVGCHGAGFDISLACSGFAVGVITAEQFLRTGAFKKALVVGADALSRVMDWTDRNTCVLFGDGAGAVVLEATPPEQNGLLAFDLNIDGAKGSELQAQNNLNNCPLVPAATPRSPYVEMNGREVFKFAVGKVPETIMTTLERANATVEDIDYLILHQANMRIMDAMTEKMGIPPEKMIINLQQYGNTSGASIPLALNEAVRDGRIQPGHRLMLCGFGGGLAWASSYLRWGRQG